MPLKLPKLVSADRSRGNRKVERAPAGDGERPSTPSKAPKAKAREPRSGGVGASLRRFGAVLWPERFPLEAKARLEARQKSGYRTPRGFIWVWAAALTLTAVAFVWHLHVRFDIIQTGYQLSQAQAEQRRLRLTQRELRLELATLKEPGRIEAQAREQLGMDRPDHERIIRLDDQGGRRREE